MKLPMQIRPIIRSINMLEKREDMQIHFQSQEYCECVFNVRTGCDIKINNCGGKTPSCTYNAGMPPTCSCSCH